MPKRGRTSDSIFAFGPDQVCVHPQESDGSFESDDKYIKLAILNSSNFLPLDFFLTTTEEHENGPFQLLQKISDEVLIDVFDQNDFFYANMEKFVTLLTSNFDHKNDRFFTHLEYLFQDKFQLSFAEILLKPVCAQIPGAFAFNDSFINGSNSLKKQHISEIKTLYKVMLREEMFVGHVTDDTHFLGFMIIVTKTDNFGLILLLDPYGAEAGNSNPLKNKVKTKAALICAVKHEYGFFERGTPPDLYEISIGFPPEFTQKGNVQCSFWSVIQPWLLLRMYRVLYQRPGAGISAFLNALKNMFPHTKNEYNFMQVHQGIGMDYKHTMSELKIYCCLLIQYYLQLREMSRWNSCKRIIQPNFSNIETLCMKRKDMLEFAQNYPKVKSKGPYVLAGDNTAYRHYLSLKQEFEKQNTEEERKVYIQSLHDIDLFRLYLKVFDNETNETFMKRLLIFNKGDSSIKYKYSLKGDFENCKYIASELPVVTSQNILLYKSTFEDVAGSSIEID